MDYATAFVNEFCNQIARMQKQLREMRTFYVFEDHRPGTPTERFDLDAKSWSEYQKLFTV